MIALSRLILMTVVLVALYCVAILTIMTAPWSFVVLAVSVAVARLQKRKQPSTAFGTGRFSEKSELRRANMLDATSGLILGRIALDPNRWIWNAIRGLFDLGIQARGACQRFLDIFRKTAKKDAGELVRLPQAVHTAVFAPTGVGKGVSCITPFLLTCEENCVVVDFKGELAMLTADARRRMGHEIVILDPFKVVTQ